ncbi:MAG TPA: nicotinate (nicotinamide) nucleotide adenylyltransferase [Bacteroidales bacterium]|nr:nicotinate (nicotinamide) nucleotide adenylyltransferase [Bacteroidales bacterium]HPJ55631.1 nicotinate (nicotinamide) nucleotide adenylyltransferase [Bacteroidales bacterium]HPQ55905.1 nicotinate (nicotinamide) nucleotide adenylyltransferase [Bacteroidales bacterium]
MNSCGLYFGSFNPFHIGHLAIVNYLVSFTDLDCLRLVVSPHNPLKDIELYSAETPKERLLHIRQVMAEKHLPADVSDVEFHLPEPLYTINTLRYLQRTEPGRNFVLVIGGDNLAVIEQWHEWKTILKGFVIYVYPRQGVDHRVLYNKYECFAKKIVLLPAPEITISSTFIREGVRAGKNMNGYLV